MIINHGTLHNPRLSFHSFLFELIFDRGGKGGGRKLDYTYITIVEAEGVNSSQDFSKRKLPPERQHLGDPRVAAHQHQLRWFPLE